MALRNGSGSDPGPLDPKVAKKLLDLLSTDDGFRELFKQDAHAALVKAGWQAPAGANAADDGMALQSGGQCLQLSADEGLASKANLLRDRQKLEKAMTSVSRFSFDCPQELKG